MTLYSETQQINTFASELIGNEVTQRETVQGGYIYALGTVKPFFPTRDLEMQYKAAQSVVNIKSQSFADVFTYEVTPAGQPNLSYRPFLYLAQQAMWVFTINNVDTYQLKALTPTQLNTLIAASGNPGVVYILVGHMTTPPQNNVDTSYSAGLNLPTVSLAHMFEESSVTGTGSNTDTILPPIEPNTGQSAMHRASNYFVSHYSEINRDEQGQIITEQQMGMEFQRQGRASGREVIQIILTCPDRNRFACSIDVADQYPFVSSPLSPFSKSN